MKAPNTNRAINFWHDKYISTQWKLKEITHFPAKL